MSENEEPPRPDEAEDADETDSVEAPVATAFTGAAATDDLPPIAEVSGAPPVAAVDGAPPVAAVSSAPAVAAVSSAPAVAPPKGARPDLLDRREPLYREVKGYTLRLDPPDLARLRELAGSRGKSDTELGEAFFDGQAERLASAIADDVPAPSELRVVVDPYSRQAFVALEGTIRGILSF